MTSFQHLGDNGNVHYLMHHFGNPETTVIKAERYLLSAPGAPRREWRIPDLLISFGADPALYKQNNAYIISLQGKPPDFVLEVASRGTWRRDRWAKREDYLAMGIPEYWRFDETGNYYGAKLAGDLLVDGEYQEIPIETVGEGGLQGYSPALDLYLRWEQDDLKLFDPKTGQHIANLESERAAHAAERAAHAAERAAREVERAARLAAEARVRELEEQLARRDREG